LELLELIDTWFAWLHWNPERILFTLPIIERPIAWYGLWFVLGFIFGYFLIVSMCRRILARSSQILPRDVANWTLLDQAIRQNPSYFNGALSSEREEMLVLLNQAASSYGWNREKIALLFPKALYHPRDLAILFVDKFTWFLVLGTLIGARLGHVFFYDWPYYYTHLSEIHKIWKGGLASHGATVGILIAVYTYQKIAVKHFPEFTFLALLDLIAIPTACAAGCIRIGNFFNQEILGTLTTVPWAIIFEDPADGSLPAPRHPVQLYEALAYFAIFGFLLTLWMRSKGTLRRGVLTGFLLFFVFFFRFFLEFFKIPQSIVFDESFLQTGQYLSLPFVISGALILINTYRKKGDTRTLENASEIPNGPPVRSFLQK
jgi:prolipoprotein diacylglyceryl transferase